MDKASDRLDTPGPLAPLAEWKAFLADYKHSARQESEAQAVLDGELSVIRWCLERRLYQNNSGEAPLLLAFLRERQRRHEVAVAFVRHAAGDIHVREHPLPKDDRDERRPKGSPDDLLRPPRASSGMMPLLERASIATGFQDSAR